MPIQVTCSCGSRITLRDEAAGRSIECPKCGAALQVPEAEERVPCPLCSAPILAVAKVCPSCRMMLPRGAARTCANCGHANALNAASCAMCCESFPPLPKLSAPAAPSSPAESLGAVDWILGILFPCVGVLLAIVYFCTSKPTRGWKTLIVSLVALLCWFIVSGIWD